MDSTENLAALAPAKWASRAWRWNTEEVEGNQTWMKTKAY